MAGLTGTFGSLSEVPDRARRSIARGDNENSRYFSDDICNVFSSRHSFYDSIHPLRVDSGNSFIWLLGEVYGLRDRCAGYTSNDSVYGDHTEIFEYALSISEGVVDAISRINGEFAGVIYNREEGLLHLFSDRISRRPIYYYLGGENGVVFSNMIGSIVQYQEVPLQYHQCGVYEYLRFGRCLGTLTPLSGVKMVPPGTVLTIGAKEKSRISTYWRPSVEGTRMPVDEVTGRFREILRECVSDRMSHDSDYGLLLSGGSDSRLLLGMSERSMSCYHMNEFMDREANVAKRAADVAGMEFTLLKRKKSYLETLLHKFAPHFNFNGEFRMAKMMGFDHVIRERTDVMLAGQYGDTVIGGKDFPRRVPRGPKQIPIGRPVLAEMKDARQVFKTFCDGGMSSRSRYPNYLEFKVSTEELQQRYISQGTGGTVESHGVTYPSTQAFALFHNIYPITNVESHSLYLSSCQVVPTRCPYWDDRILDLVCSVHPEVIVQNDIVSRVLRRVNKPLSRFSRPDDVLPLSYSRFTRDLTNHLVDGVRRRLRLDTEPSVPDPSFMNHGPWSDFSKIIRNTSFTRETLIKNKRYIDQSDIFSWDRVWSLYEGHMQGEWRMNELFRVLSFLEWRRWSTRDYE